MMYNQVSHKMCWQGKRGRLSLCPGDRGASHRRKQSSFTVFGKRKERHIGRGAFVCKARGRRFDRGMEHPHVPPYIGK